MNDTILSLILKHLEYSETPQERAALLEWMEESPENCRVFSDFVASWRLHETLSSPALPSDTAGMLSRLNARIDAVASLDSGKRRFPWGRIWAATCAVAATLVLGVFLLPRMHVGTSAPMELVYNDGDDTRPLLLEDGTHVYLRPGSKLSYNVLTQRGRRVAELTGDAYFDVARDESKPFFIKADGLRVQVLGTAFSVSSSEGEAQVVLERGSVRLLSEESVPMVSLSPNQKATWRAATGDLRVEPVYATAFVTDKYNLVSMQDVTVAQILDGLYERFGIRVVSDADADARRFNLAFLKSDRLQDVISMIEFMTGNTFSIDNTNN